jgi:hypothetical protein
VWLLVVWLLTPLLAEFRQHLAGLQANRRRLSLRRDLRQGVLRNFGYFG